MAWGREREVIEVSLRPCLPGEVPAQTAEVWGVGLRLNLPIGLLRLDYGIPISNSSGKAGSGKFQFSAGGSRDF